MGRRLPSYVKKFFTLKLIFSLKRKFKEIFSLSESDVRDSRGFIKEKGPRFKKI